MRLDWAPPGSSRLVTKYLQTLGEDNIPIQVYGNFTTLHCMIFGGHPLSVLTQYNVPNNI